MARRSSSCIYSVLQVKPFSGYYRSCPTCERKLGTLEFNYSIPLQKTRYWCRSCCVDWNSKELGLSYCLILTVTDYPSGTKVVSLFGRALEPIFGLPATQMHKYLDVLEGGEMSKHELLLNALRTLLIGACVELRFASGSDTGQVMNRSISNGIKILGGNEETVLMLLSAQTKLPQCHKSFVRDLGPEERDTNNLAAANDSSFSTTTQHNSEVHHDSSSFLYDTKSQRVDPTNHPLQLESFLETQNRCDAPSQYISDSGPFGVDEVPDVEASQQIILELESEWENSQQTHKQQLPGDLDFDLALSEEVVSELQQTFDLSGDIACTPEPGAAVAKRQSLATTQAPDTTFTGLNIITPLSKVIMSKSFDSTIVRTMPGYGTPELFSSCKPSHKKLTHLRGIGEHSLSSSSFSPELFGPTPVVCRQLSSSPDLEPANICTGATPPGLRRSKLHTPKRSLLHDSTLTTPTLLCQAAAESQASRLGTRPGNSTPQTESKESTRTLSYTVSSPDLFS